MEERDFKKTGRGKIAEKDGKASEGKRLAELREGYSC